MRKRLAKALADDGSSDAASTAPTPKKPRRKKTRRIRTRRRRRSMRRTRWRRRRVIPAAARAHECGMRQYSEACPQYLKRSTRFGALCAREAEGAGFARVTRHLRSLLGRVEVGVGVHAQAGFARANQFCEHDQTSAGVIMYIDFDEFDIICTRSRAHDRGHATQAPPFRTPPRLPVGRTFYNAFQSSLPTPSVAQQPFVVNSQLFRHC